MQEEKLTQKDKENYSDNEIIDRTNNGVSNCIETKMYETTDMIILNPLMPGFFIKLIPSQWAPCGLVVN